VLIVDDVVTTGHTLSELAACFASVDFEFYTLASAFRPGKDHAC
jgi:predicted amidophosphoribosyltransferase